MLFYESKTKSGIADYLRAALFYSGKNASKKGGRTSARARYSNSCRKSRKN